jgi:C-terminal processing protease CtpA/Prc
MKRGGCGTEFCSKLTYRCAKACVASYVACCVALSLGVSSRSAVGDDFAALSNAAQTILAPDLQEHVDVLADDSFEGREAGKRGGYAAAGYIVDKLEKYGVQPAGSNREFYQLFGNGYRNVLGMIPGSSEDVSQEVIVVGAHYDHVGYGSSRNSFGPIGFIHNGADDNASGVAGLLEIAQAIHESGLKTPRSILLCFWDGEEKGLLGSKHWTANPTVPLNRVVFAFNLDMIGRLRDQGVEVHGTRTAAGLRRMISQSNDDTQVKLKFSWELRDNSDHHSFFSRNIPTVMFHTGLHEKYHRPTDDADTVNAIGMQQISRLTLRTVWAVSSSDTSWSFRTLCTSESPQDQKRLHTPHSPLRPRLGIGWPEKFDIEQGIPITNVRNGSAAAMAGLRINDRLLTMNGKPIRSTKEFQLDIHAAKSPVVLSVVRANSDGPFEAEVTLNGDPARIGFSWRLDTGDTHAVVVTRVTPGSAATHAGVRVGDHIYELNGAPLVSSQWFLERLVNDTGPFKLQVDRQGKCQELLIEPLPPIDKTDI